MNYELLTWLIPLPPLLAFFIIFLATHKNNKLSHSLAIAGAGLSWVFSMMVFFFAIGYEKELTSSISWLPTAETWLNIGVQVDALTAITLFFVAWTVLMIFIYSVGYHNFGQPKGDHDRPGLAPHGAELIDQDGKHKHVLSIEPMYARFFGFISLFAFAMYVLVVSNNLLTLYIGWEIMGLCSYLLIGFWYAKPSAKAAAQKAFLTTRIGDVFMLIGLAALYTLTGSLHYEVIFSETVLHDLATTISPVFGLSWAGLIGLLILMGVVGKSSQFPLHVWLPDAMEGPTPVSAMIHALPGNSIFPGTLSRLGWWISSYNADGSDGSNWLFHRFVFGNDCCCPTGCKKGSGLFHNFTIGFYDCCSRCWCVYCGSIPPCDSCDFQSLIIPWIRIDNSWYGTWRITYAGTYRSARYV